MFQQQSPRRCFTFVCCCWIAPSSSSSWPVTVRRRHSTSQALLTGQSIKSNHRATPKAITSFNSLIVSASRVGLEEEEEKEEEAVQKI